MNWDRLLVAVEEMMENNYCQYICIYIYIYYASDSPK